MSYESMPLDWGYAQINTLKITPIDDDAHDESDNGAGSHRALSTRTRYRRSWSKLFTNSAKRDAVKTFMESHKTVRFFHYTDPDSGTISLVRFSTGFNENPYPAYSAWEIKFSIEDV